MGTDPSRREILKGASAAGAGLVAGTVATAPAAHASVVSSDVTAVSPGGYLRVNGAPPSRIDFGRMFPHLPPFAEADDTVRAALMELGTAGGILDAHDQLSGRSEEPDPRPDGQRQPDCRRSLRDQPRQPDDDRRVDLRRAVHRPRHHLRPDLSAGVPQNPLVSPNTRTPALDLDSVFGGGPERRPDLYVEQSRRLRRPEAAHRQRWRARGRPESPAATAPTRPCSATLATTRTSSSPGCTAPTSPSTTGRSTSSLNTISPRSRPLATGRRTAHSATRRTCSPAKSPCGTTSGFSSTSTSLRSLVSRWWTTCSRTAIASTDRPCSTPLCPSSSAPPPTASATAWSVPRTGRTSRAAALRAPTRPRRRSSRSFSTTPRPISTDPSTSIATICSGDTRRGDATSAGRRSSTSATARSRTTRRSTRRSRAFSSPSRCPRSPPTPSPHPSCCRNATCCAS